MAWTERYVDAAAAGGGDGTTTATSGANGAWTWAEAVAAATQGQRVNVKAGTYSRTTTTDTLATSGNTGGIWFRGYNTTAGDCDTNPALTKPAITYTTGRLVISGTQIFASNLNISGAFTTGAQVAVTGGHCGLWRCRVENTNAAAASGALQIATNANTRVLHCWCKATSTATSVIQLSAGGDILWTYVTGGGYGITTDTAGAHALIGNLIDRCGSHGIYTNVTTAHYIVQNTVVGCAGDGLRLNLAFGSGGIVGNLFANNGGYGINNIPNTSYFAALNYLNDFYSNTSGDTNTIGNNIFHAQSEGASPFADYANADYNVLFPSLAALAPWTHGLFENTALTSYLGLGAMQHKQVFMRNGLRGGFIN